MSVRRSRSAGAAIVAALVLVLVVGGCGGAPTATLAPTVTVEGAQRVEVAYAGGSVTGGLARYAVPRGSTVELVVSSDVADEVHVHGYDRFGFVTAGASTTLRFVADVPGVFEVELERGGAALAQLQVS